MFVCLNAFFMCACAHFHVHECVWVCLWATVGCRRGYILQQLSCMRYLRPSTRLLQGLVSRPARVRQTENIWRLGDRGWMGEHSNNTSHESVNCATIKRGRVRQRVSMLAMLTKPERCAAEGRDEREEGRKAKEVRLEIWVKAVMGWSLKTVTSEENIFKFLLGFMPPLPASTLHT